MNEADRLLKRIAETLAPEDANIQPAADRHSSRLYNYLKTSAETPDWAREEAATAYYRFYVERLGRS